jgi:hypothetical protein
MLRDFLKGNHFKLATATMPGLWGVMGPAQVSGDGSLVTLIGMLACKGGAMGNLSILGSWGLQPLKLFKEGKKADPNTT